MSPTRHAGDASRAQRNAGGGVHAALVAALLGPTSSCQGGMLRALSHPGLLVRDPSSAPARVPVLPGSPLPSGLGAKSAVLSWLVAPTSVPAAFCLFFMASMAFSLRACLWPL